MFDGGCWYEIYFEGPRNDGDSQNHGRMDNFKRPGISRFGAGNCS